MLRKRSGRSDRTIPPPIHPAHPTFSHSTLVNPADRAPKEENFQDGRKTDCACAVFPWSPLRNCQMSRLHGLHTYTEREIRILSQYTQCVYVAQIYFYTQQPELMLFTLVTYIFFLCVCARALASFFFHPIYHTRAAPTTTPDNITQDGPLRNVVLKKISRQRNPGSFQKGERDDTENQRVNDEVCIRKKAAAAAHCNRDPNEEGRLPILRPFSYVETASPDQNLLRH